MADMLAAGCAWRQGDAIALDLRILADRHHVRALGHRRARGDAHAFALPHDERHRPPDELAPDQSQGDGGIRRHVGAAAGEAVHRAVVERRQVDGRMHVAREHAAVATRQDQRLDRQAARARGRLQRRHRFVEQEHGREFRHRRLPPAGDPRAC